MPFAKYKNFKHCVQENQDKEDPAGFCAWLKRKVEGQDPLVLRYLSKKPDLLYGLYRMDLLSSSILEIDLLTKEQAHAALKGDKIWAKVHDAVVIDDHRWIHVWANSIKQGRDVFLNKEQIRKLHDLVVDEMQRRSMKSGLNHQSPIEFGALKLSADNVTMFLESRKEFMVDPAFISIIGSSVAGKEKPGDLDLLVRSSKNSSMERIIREQIPDKIGGYDLVWDPAGPNGPNMGAYELWVKPVENSSLR